MIDVAAVICALFGVLFAGMVLLALTPYATLVLVFGIVLRRRLLA